MLVINYSGNKPQQDRFKFAVNGDNKSQTIKFVLKKQQGDIDLSSPLFSIYFLCQSQDKRFVDKAEIESFIVEGNDIILEYKLLGKHTQFKAIDVGLSFEDENQEVVYKTASTTISIQNGIMADQEIPNIYPSILKQMEKEIVKTNVKLQEKASVFEVDNDFDVLETWLNNNDEPIKNGDVIYSTSEGYNGIVENKGDTFLNIRVLKDDMVSVYTYIIEDEEWVFDNQQDFSFDGTSLKQGRYISNNGKFVLVEEIPEDYAGYLLEINPEDTDTLAFGYWVDGDWEDLVSVGMSNIGIGTGSNRVVIDTQGTNKLNFASLTHSFNELDPTLKQIVDDAITDAGVSGVACTEAQWSVIKALLDKSLYLNYNGYSMIKSVANGIDLYIFGTLASNSGETLELLYSSDTNLLFVKFYEL